MKHTMLTKRLLTLLLALMLILTTLTGCNKPGNDTTSLPGAAQSGETTDGPDSAGDAGPAYPEGYIQLSDEEMDLSVREAKGTNGVVSSASPIASKVGLEVLERGGNAVDAAVAVAVALTMVEPNASGIGGDGYMLVYEAATGKTTFLDYKGAAPAAFTLDYLSGLSSDDKHTGSGALVPGAVAGLYKANEMFGTMSFADLLQPTIDYATYGVPVTHHMANVYMDTYSLLTKYPETAKVFLNDGFPYSEGEIYKSPDLAKTLALIAEQGPDAFYKGEIAEDIVASVQAAGGVMTLQDMANYAVSVREPVSTNYRGYTVVTCSPGSSGVVVLEALNMAETFDVADMGHNQPDTLHMWAEIFKMTGADRRRFVGDPDFSDITAALNLANKAYGRNRAKLIDMEFASYGGLPGQPYGYEGEHTSHVSVIDKHGNMVAMTNTLSDYFGCTVTVQNRGFVLNDLSFNFSTDSSFGVNHPAPGKKVRSTISPCLIFGPDGQPIGSLGTPGAARIVTTIPQLISNIVDFDMDIQTAINQPRIFQDRDGALRAEGGIDTACLNNLEKRGHIVTLYKNLDLFFGGAQGVLILEDGTLHGGADPRRDGKALAY